MAEALRGGDGVPLPGSGVMFFAQTTRREN
jgi:hypothetical protein